MKNKNQITEFSYKIWEYYKDNKRQFPWRETHDPYEILVSEIMLQQTQAERVVPKYIEFLSQFPNLQSLSAASNKEILAVWQGLGYNRRALYLKKISETMTRDSNGKLPVKREDLERLPGIGRYTSGAIMVFAYNIPVSFIETNIRRVFIDHFFKREDKISDDEIIRLVEKSLDLENSREWYYALMDYGAYLAKQIPNPNKKSNHYTPQSKFEGSVRQIRGEIVKLFLEDKKISIQEIAGRYKRESSQIRSIIEQLEKEGFTQK